jgi:hypothetical protein
MADIVLGVGTGQTAGGAERLDMALVDYIPGQCTPPASTGCAMAFAYWT